MQPVRKQLQTSVHCSSSDKTSEKLQSEIEGFRAEANQQFLRVSIFSPDGFIRDFLQGLLAFQGYQCINVSEIKDCFWDVSPYPDHVVFLDGFYCAGPQSDDVWRRIQQLTQAGVAVFVLADQQGRNNLKVLKDLNGCQILQRPLDYRQVGQAMGRICC